jgi:glycosyltransferase involved in cell wall biosynthesis
MTQRIAYFVNRYPAVSHTFIRREIHALEGRGFDVLRVALHGHHEPLVDELDIREQQRTRHVLAQPVTAIAGHVFRRFTADPGAFVAAFWLALKTGWRAARPLQFHLGYFVEACTLVDWLDEFAAHHVHAHFGTNSTEIVMLAHRLGGPPYSFTVHGPEEFDMPLALKLREKAHQAAFVVAITSYARAQLFRWIERSDWSKVKVVHCGLQADSFAEADDDFPAAPRFVCIGRLNEQKGQLLLIEAARILKEQGRDFEIVLIGDGELQPQLDSFISQYNLEGTVILTGSLSGERVREEILRSRALVLPSFAEGLPIVIMEAMAAGRPVLTTYVAGIPELVRPGENGWLIPAGSVDALVDVMNEVLDCSPDELARMGARGRDRVKARHSAETEAGKLAALIGSALMAAGADEAAG